MSLKTLKDLGEEFEDTGRIYIEDTVLKAEAVNELKEEPCEFFKQTGIGMTISIKKYIKWKNNLTEEDLI